LSSGQKTVTLLLSENRRYRCIYHTGFVMGRKSGYLCIKSGLQKIALSMTTNGPPVELVSVAERVKAVTTKSSSG